MLLVAVARAVRRLRAEAWLFLALTLFLGLTPPGFILSPALPVQDVGRASGDVIGPSINLMTFVTRPGPMLNTWFNRQFGQNPAKTPVRLSKASFCPEI